MSEQDKDQKSSMADTRFMRLPSVAERKLGADLDAAPIRLDPRAIDHMQDTIDSLRLTYAEALQAQIDRLVALATPACEGYGPAREKLYTIAHDTRGLAGTFGFPLVGRIAHSLCDYLELGKRKTWLDTTLVSLHASAMRDAVKTGSKNEADDEAVLRELEALVDRALSAAQGQVG
jgi:hypothetical protein